MSTFKNPEGVPSAVPCSDLSGIEYQRIRILVPILHIVEGLLTLDANVKEAVPPADTETYKKKRSNYMKTYDVKDRFTLVVPASSSPSYSVAV